MAKCLVTKLKGSVDNNELLRIGEMRIKVESVESPTKNTQGFSCTFSEPTTLEIVGEGYFTDDTLTENKGKSMVVPANNNTNIIVSQATIVSIRDKYNLVTLYCFISNGSPYGQNKVLNIEDLKYSHNIRELNLYNMKVTGDIANLKNLTALTVLLLNNTNVTGDISALKNITSLNRINLSNTNVTGDIANLKNLTALTGISLTNIQITGDIAQLESCSNINNIVIQNSVNGDLSKLPKKCFFISFVGSNDAIYTWTSRPSSYNIFAIEGKIKVDNIDKMLQDLAQCQAAIPSSNESWYKIIKAIGTRTSASDAAVQTLQSKGYTVSITPA